MKADIHPKYFATVQITCSCGNVVTAGSTRENLKTELCSKCHPFYTGQQKLVDTAGRVDKFQEKRKKAQALKEAAVERKASKAKKAEIYKEKEVPVEVIERSSGVAEEEAQGKWGTPVGEMPSEEVVKEETADGEVAPKGAWRASGEAAPKGAWRASGEAAPKKKTTKTKKAKKA